MAGKTGKKRKNLRKGKPASKMVTISAMASFTGTAQQSITRNEIYHRLEWYFDARHDPTGPHTIDPTAPIEAFFGGLDGNTGREVLYFNINKASRTYVPAWASPLFHAVQIPWESLPPVALGIKDVKTFGDLIQSLVLSYRHLGWIVT